MLMLNICKSAACGISSFIVTIWHLLCRIVGTSLGIGLGLGLAGHLYELLEQWKENEGNNQGASIDDEVMSRDHVKQRISSHRSASITLPIHTNLFKDNAAATTLSPSTKTTRKENRAMEDSHSYHSLMKSAGYVVDDGMLRCQMVRGEQAHLATMANGTRQQQPYSPEQVHKPRTPPTIYKFDKGETAATQMRRLWPNLAPVVNESLAKLTEFVIRDYVASWYSKVDENVGYSDPAVDDTAPVPDDTSAALKQIGKVECVQGVSERIEARRSSDGNSVLNSSFNSKESKRSFKESDIPAHLTKSMPAMTKTTAITELQANTILSSSVSSIPPMLKKNKQKTQQQRTMVLTTTGTRSSPFIDSLYSAFSYLLGVLATRASENVNVFEVLLLHFPNVLGQNVRVYREMRRIAVEKKQRRVAAEAEKWRKNQKEAMRENSGERFHGGEINVDPSLSRGISREGSSSFMLQPPQIDGSLRSSKKASKREEITEIAVVREYLLAGRFHRALTFGLDVPSLLFADPLGRDCAPGPSYSRNDDASRRKGHPDEDAILEYRLLNPISTLINECELDYNRVLAARISKLSLPKNELDSSIVRTMLVEMLASCVLNPIMGCFSPEYVNGWIIKGLGLVEEEGSSDPEKGVDSNESAGTIKRHECIASSTIYGGDSLRRTESVASSMKEEYHEEDHITSIGSDDDEILDSGVDDGTGHFRDIIGCDGSIVSDTEDSLYGAEHEFCPKDRAAVLSSCSKADQIITLLSMSIIELSRFIDFDECRHSRDTNVDININWDSSKCRDAVRHLVLVIEAAILFGGRSERKRTKEVESNNALTEMEIEATLEQSLQEGGLSYNGDDIEVDIEVVSENKTRPVSTHHHTFLSTALMELTADIDSFEKAVMDAEQYSQESDDDDVSDDGQNNTIDVFIPRPNDLSTLRTLVAAWLHTGQAYRVLSIIIRAKHTIMRPFYHKSAFLRNDNYAKDFTKLLRQLEGVEILVDTMAVLASQCLLVDNGLENLIRIFEHGVSKNGQVNIGGRDASVSMLSSGSHRHQPEVFGSQRVQLNNSNPLSMVGSVRANIQHNRDRLQRFAQSATESFHWGGGKTPDQVEHLSSQTHRQSKSGNTNSLHNMHQNSHNTPSYLDFNKNSVLASSLRTERERRHQSWLSETKCVEKVDCVFRSKGITDKDILMHKELHHLSKYFYSNTNEIRIDPCSIGKVPYSASAANVTVKAVSGRRKIEVPDEDSSFLLRGQSRPLKPAAIHRDQNAANLACKIYVAMFEEPAIHPRTKRFYGGRYLRQCLLKYYPNDRTASVAVANEISILDRRKGQSGNNFSLPESFHMQRHPCMKVATGSILSSPLMDLGDFAATPRVGKAIDFLYRMSLFEKPMVELAGKKFVVQDASNSHRADASSLELSDAAMSAAIIIRGSCGLNVCDTADADSSSFNIKVSDDGTPLVLLRSVSHDDINGEQKSKDEARPYRPSFIRAALYIKSARQEAQFQTLTQCIKGGSARSSSKLKADELLQPTLTLLSFANSRRKDEQSVLLRDLRFGINHIDRGQLCRNGLLNPRYPTVLRGLTTEIEGAVEVKAGSNVDLLGLPTMVLFKIKVTAIVEYIGDDYNNWDKDSKKLKRPKSRFFREEWTVSRSLRDFSIFHKHIKGQVSPSEHSASASARIVGAATAAFTIVGGNNTNNQRQRSPLVPSLSVVTKSGTLGLSTRKVIEKRKKLLDDYLKYLVAPNNLLGRCPELLKFLGAYTSPFPAEGNEIVDDGFGRQNTRRDELDTKKLEAGEVEVKRGMVQSMQGNDPVATQKAEEVSNSLHVNQEEYDTVSTTDNVNITTDTVSRDETVLAVDNDTNDAAQRLAIVRAGEIRLKDVRRAAFQLLRNIFDLENASFFRSRVIAAIKTMTLAIATVQDFQLMLFQTHVKYMNGDWISGWIFFVVDMFWPNGVFYTRGPDLTEQEKSDLKINSKEILETTLPDQLKTVLGKHTEEGLDILHEMLQNRLVLKSMAYMLLDIVWGEIFPELSDFVTGSDSLDKNL
ncbi:hypothetical protein ACHAXS_011639 [Conticribra weissflogii]